MNADPPQAPAANRVESARQTALYAAIAAALMLFFGFERPFDFAQGSPLYISSVFATNWLLRVGGLALAATALLCFVGLGWALLLDAVVSGLIGAALVAIGAIWMFEPDVEGLLFLIFGAMFLNAARVSWRSFGIPVSAFVSAAPADPEPPGRPDAAARENARARLLQTKANLRRSPVAENPSGETAALVDSPAAELPPASPAPAPGSGSARSGSAAAVVDLPEEGFLAELGRADQPERK